MSDDLVAFFSARLDEDEARAQKKLHRYVDGEWVRIICDPVIGPFGGQSQLRDIGTGMYVADMSNPKRVLREVAAGRALLAWWQRGDPDPDGPAPSPTFENYRKSLPGYQLLLHAIAVWSDHPDYRQEWAPSAG